MTDEMRLFGTVGSERLAPSIAEAFESFVEPYYDPDDARAWPVVLEEWTVAANRDFFPSGDTVHPMLGVQVAWFTDLEDPCRDEVGLTSTMLTCDRLEYRYEVTDRNGHLKLKPWVGSNVQARTRPHWQMDLHRFARPKTWWIALQPVFVTFRPRNENYAEPPDQEKQLSFVGQFHVDQAGALWCETSDRRLIVFGPGMWIRVEAEQ